MKVSLWVRQFLGPADCISTPAASMRRLLRPRQAQDETEHQSVQYNRRRSSEIVVQCIPTAAANRRFAAADACNLLRKSVESRIECNVVMKRSMTVRLVQIPVDALNLIS
jgi:hypothetical protein